MTAAEIKEVEQRLESVKCAICKSSRFGIDTRSIKDDGECKGICIKCYYNFPVFTDMEFYLKTQPDVPYWLKEITCQNCEHRGVKLDFRIVMSVRESIYFVTCDSCQHRFAERSYLEVFE